MVLIDTICMKPHTKLLTRLGVFLILAVWSLRSFADTPQEGALLVQCSSTASQVADRLAMEFSCRVDGMAVNCRSCDSIYVMKCLQEHKCNVGLVIESLAALNEKMDTRLGAFPLARYAIGVIVNRNGPVRTLEIGELGKMFQGEIVSWSNVDDSGSARKIEVFSPPLSTTQCFIFQRCVMHGRGFAKELTNPSTDSGCQKKCSDEVMGEVINKRGAIGFFQLSPDAIVDKRVHLLGIVQDSHSKPVIPTPETIAKGSYPITDRLTLYLHPDAPPTAHEFCKFATGPEGAKIIKQFGLWPEYELNKERGKQRLADVKTGKGVELAVCDKTGSEEVMQDLATEFVKAKAAVQLKFQKERTSADLLLTDGDNGQAAANLKSVELGRMAVGVVVHPENPLDSLPIDEARDIFTGKIKKWPAVRGAAPVMHVFGLKQSDSIAQLLKEKLALTPGPSPNEARGVEKPLHYVNQPSSEKVILAVARDPAAIGFVDLSQLPENEKSVKRVKVTVGQKDPRSTNIWYDDNPLARVLTLYVSSKASQTAKDFAEFLTLEHCKEIISKHNLLPPLHVSSQVADVPKGEGTEGDEPQLALDEETVKKPMKKKPVEEPKSVATMAEKPQKTQKPAVKYVADDEPADTTPEKKQPGVPALSSEQTVWLVGGVVGVIVLSLGIGWLRAPHRKKRR